MRIIFISYDNQPDCSDPEIWMNKISAFATLMEALAEKAEIIYLKQMNFKGCVVKNKVTYLFEKSSVIKPRLPWKLNKIIKELSPDVLILSGIRSPIQVIHTRLFLGKKIIILGKHHAELPPKGLRKLFQRWADKSFDAYLFTSKENAIDWIKAGIIRNENKIFEFSGSSTLFKKVDKIESLQQTGMNGSCNFLWVGRLNANKDPITVLSGFEKYLMQVPTAKLYMIFQTDELLNDVREKINSSVALKSSVKLVGKIPYVDLQNWYSAADFFISGSHSEGGSFALVEAVACGCIPIITKIPAALKMTGNGKYAISFEPGNADDLSEKLLSLSSILKTEFSETVEQYFAENLSADSMAKQLYEYCKFIVSGKNSSKF